MADECSPPVLRTERLCLRPHRPSDFEASYELWSDPITTTFIGGRPSTREESWARILRYMGLWPALGYGYWVVSCGRTGGFLGEVGFADFRRDMVPPLTSPEAGWAIAPGAHGHGYATEALLAALGWADRSLGVSQTACIINGENAASLRVADKVGYHRVGSAEYQSKTTDVFSRPSAAAELPHSPAAGRRDRS
jgi:RimJ/RimL family protein N-acetyltransferase